MAVFSFEQGMPTSTCPTIWALRMRVSMSAIGSVMLIAASSPARLDDAGHLAAQRELAQLVAPQAELLVDAPRAARQRAAVAQPGRRGVARQLLQLDPRRVLVLVGRLDVVEHLEQRGALRLEFLDGLAALLFTELHCELGHRGQPFWACFDSCFGSCLNGKRKAASSARASSSVFAEVVMAMSIPRSASILSYSISGKMICSFTP